MVEVCHQAVSAAHGSECVKKPSSCDCMPAANGRATVVMITQNKPDKAIESLVNGISVCVGRRVSWAVGEHVLVILSLQCLLSVCIHPYHDFLLSARYGVSACGCHHELAFCSLFKHCSSPRVGVTKVLF